MRELMSEEINRVAGGQLLLTGWAPAPRLQTQPETTQPQVAPNQMNWLGTQSLNSYVGSLYEPKPYIVGL